MVFENLRWRMKRGTKVDEKRVDNRARCVLPAGRTTRRNDEGKGAKIAKFHEWTQLSEICTQVKTCYSGVTRAGNRSQMEVLVECTVVYPYAKDERDLRRGWRDKR